MRSGGMRKLGPEALIEATTVPSALRTGAREAHCDGDCVDHRVTVPDALLAEEAHSLSLTEILK